MKEQLITFETAQLAKEKGFKEPTYAWYAELEYPLPKKELVESGKNGIKQWFRNGSVNDDRFISAPTQSLLQKWLRDVHGIYIDPYIDPYQGDVWYTITVWKDGEHKASYKKDLSDNNYNSHEDALEEGLQEALNLI